MICPLENINGIDFGGEHNQYQTCICDISQDKIT